MFSRIKHDGDPWKIWVWNKTQNKEVRRVLLGNGAVVSGTGCVRQDIHIGEGRIVQIGPGLGPLEGEEVTDVSSCLVVPGGIGVRIHFDMLCSGIMVSDGFENGIRAAATGGTTTMINFSEPKQGASLQDGLDRRHEKTDEWFFADYSFHMAVAQYNQGIEGETLSMIRRGVTSFKAYTICKGDLRMEDRDIYRSLSLIRKHDVLLIIYCENGDILDMHWEELAAGHPADISLHPLSRPSEAGHETISRMIGVVRLLVVPVYIVHANTRQAFEEIGEAERERMKVYHGTYPQYLFLLKEKYRLPGFEGAKYVCNPPLRSGRDQETLWRGLRQGIVDTVFTDRCFFNYKDQKGLGREDLHLVPGGSSGVENRLELMYSRAGSHSLTYSGIIRIVAENSAKVFGLYPRKGAMRPGSDADLVVIRPDSSCIVDVGTQG